MTTRCNRLILAAWVSVLLLVFSAVASPVRGAPQDALPQAPSPAAPADVKPSPSEAPVFLRVRRDDQQRPVAIETAVVRYESQAGRNPAVQVDLIGAVHVADAQYYEQLNELFKDYDAVLYELVAPEGTRPEPGEARTDGNPVSALQQVMKNVLKLEFQLEKIDYSRPNLVHADMSPQEFSQSMKDRGESFLTMFLRLLADSMASQAKRGTARAPGGDIELLVALIAKDRAYRLKRIMAEEFETLEEQMSSLTGPNGSTLITQRNKKALEVLRKEIQQGKRRLAIFYGTGHLSDMERRLLADFELQKASQRWLVAWTIAPEQAQ